jgi:hypothetical protein
MVKKKERKIGECIYCGDIKPLSKDHVPPRGLFSKPWPNNLITVPSCDACNGGSSKDDEYFRYIISMIEGTDTHPEALKVQEKLVSSASKPNKFRFHMSILSRVCFIEKTTPSGLYIGRRPSIIVDTNRIVNVVSRIIKGLFYYERRVRLPNSYKVIAIPAKYKELADPALADIVSQSPKVIGKGVFSYRCHFQEHDPNESGWLMFFYGGAPFLGATLSITNTNDSAREA